MLFALWESTSTFLPTHQENQLTKCILGLLKALTQLGAQIDSRTSSQVSVLKCPHMSIYWLELGWNLCSLRNYKPFIFLSREPGWPFVDCQSGFWNLSDDSHLHSWTKRHWRTSSTREHQSISPDSRLLTTSREWNLWCHFQRKNSTEHLYDLYVVSL